MGADTDGTIDLLTGPEGQMIAELGRNTVQTPTSLSRNLARSRYWVMQDAEALRKLGLVTIHRIPKQVTIELSSQGRLLIEQVEARITRTGRFLTGAELDDLADEAGHGYLVTLPERQAAAEHLATAHGYTTLDTSRPVSLRALMLIHRQYGCDHKLP